MNLFEFAFFTSYSFLTVFTAYLLLFSIAGKLKKGRGMTVHSTLQIQKIAILIPAYKEDAVIVESAKQALQQNYPSDFFDVIIIADSLQPATLQQLSDLPVQVMQVTFELSTKAKALNYALQHLADDYQIALILDADNIMKNDVLVEFNQMMQGSVKVAQGHRIAKNINTSIAFLDAVSEEVNNHIFRKGHVALGLSAALIGSGMAFKFNLFKKVMSTIQAVGGFDKELELKLLRENIKIAYLENAFIYDEKVPKASALQAQRRRWISAQLHYFKAYFWSGFYHLVFHGNIDYFNKVFQMILPGRLLLLGATVFAICISALVGNPLILGGWLFLLTANIFALLLAIPSNLYGWKFVKALFSLPKALAVLLLALIQIKGANTRFIHTEHSSISVNKQEPCNENRN